MRIGQIVFIKNYGYEWYETVQTGIVIKKELEAITGKYWYEVLCNDGQNHVMPVWMLSPAGNRPERTHRKNKNNQNK